MDRESRRRTVVLAVSSASTLAWLGGGVAAGFAVYRWATGGEMVTASAIAIGCLALGATLAMVEHRLSDAGWLS